MHRLGNEGAAIGGGILVLIGGIFALVSCPLLISLAAAPVGIPFMLIGAGMLLGGGGLVAWRYQTARRVEQALAEGPAALGEITSVEQNYSVTINGRSPWIIAYRFQAGGQEYTGSLQSLDPPGPRFQAGVPAYVVYNQDDPRLNTLYL